MSVIVDLRSLESVICHRMIPLAMTSTEPDKPAIDIARIVMEAQTSLDLDGTWFDDPACLCPIEDLEDQ